MKFDKLCDFVLTEGRGSHEKDDLGYYYKYILSPEALDLAKSLTQKDIESNGGGEINNMGRHPFLDLNLIKRIIRVRLPNVIGDVGRTKHTIINKVADYIKQKEQEKAEKQIEARDPYKMQSDRTYTRAADDFYVWLKNFSKKGETIISPVDGFAGSAEGGIDGESEEASSVASKRFTGHPEDESQWTGLEGEW